MNIFTEKQVPPADLVLLNGDICTVNPDNPAALEAVMTIIDGKIVLEKR